jgi:hypothetical protein
MIIYIQVVPAWSDDRMWPKHESLATEKFYFLHSEFINLQLYLRSNRVACPFNTLMLGECEA